MSNQDYFSNDSFIERTVNKKHSLIQDATRENIEKHNFKIQFHKRTWVLKREGGGFVGRYNTRASEIDPIPFGVLSVEKDKKTQCSRIHVWSDGACDGQNCFFINVPNGLFKQIHDEGVDK